jgi:predicted metal-dependent hydrolase
MAASNNRGQGPLFHIKMKTRPLQHNNRLIPYEVHHKPTVTRRIHLRASAEGTLVVIAPKRMSKRAIHKTLQERAHKVARFLADALRKQQEQPRLDYIYGEEHLYLGEKHSLEVLPGVGRRGTVCFSDDRIQIITADCSPETVKKMLIAWYRQQAKQHFSARIDAIGKNADWIGGRAPAMRLRKMKRTWGSCSASGVITLNPRLIKAPQACIDYVIAHELCHLQEMNHGKAFYALQTMLYPQWYEARAHLQARAHVYLHE